MTDNFNKIGSNIFFLGIYQLANLIFPVLISPFLISKIGIANFGLVTSAQALMLFFNIICDYGFNMSATKDISLQKSNQISINIIVSTVLSIKLILLIISLILLIIVVFLVPHFYKYANLYLFSFTITLGRAFFPVWFFQGIQKMYYLIFFSFFSKGLAALLLIYFIHSQNSFLIINPIIGFMDFLGTVLLLGIIAIKYKWNFILPNSATLKIHIKKGFLLFLSTFFATICVSSNVLILAALSTNTNLGIYSVVDKIVAIIKQFPTIIFQAAYPQACRLWITSKQFFFTFIRTLFYFLAICIITISTLVCTFSSFICSFFSKSYTAEMSILLKFISFTPIISALNLPAYIIILLTEKTKFSFQVIMLASITTIFFNFILVNKYGYWGSLVAIVLSDLIITISNNVYIIFKSNLNFLKQNG